MKLALLTAIWERPKLTKLVTDYYSGLPFDDRMYVYSKEEDRDAIDGSAWRGVYADNEPLSDKWTTGIRALRGSVDAVMIVGSDDLVTPRYISAARYLINKGVDYLYLPSLFFYNAPTGEMHYCLSDNLGLGRVMSRRLLDELDWSPWGEGLDRGLDHSMLKKMAPLREVKTLRLGLKACHQMGIAAMDIKGGETNLWSYKHTTFSLVGSKVSNPEETLKKHFPAVANELIKWKTDNENT